MSATNEQPTPESYLQRKGGSRDVCQYVIDRALLGRAREFAQAKGFTLRSVVEHAVASYLDAQPGIQSDPPQRP